MPTDTAREMSVKEYRTALRGAGTWSREKADLHQWLACLHLSRPAPMVSEHRFHPTRKWRFDWAFPAIKVAVEFDGLYGGTAHRSRAMVAKDSEKMNQAALLGWIVIRVNAPSLRDGSGYRDIEDAISLRMEPTP